MIKQFIKDKQNKYWNLFLLSEYKTNFIQIYKYILVGLFTALIDSGFFFLFAVRLNFNYLFVSIIGFLFVNLIHYYLSSNFVFKSGARFKFLDEIFLSYIISSLGLIIHLVLLFICIDIIYIDKMLSKIIAIGVVFFWNYLLRRNFIFKSVLNGIDVVEK